MSADKNTKIPVDTNTDSGFLSGPISSDLDAEKPVDSGVISGDLDSCTGSLSKIVLDDIKIHIPSQTTRPRDLRSRSKNLPPLIVLYTEQDEDGDTQLHIAAVHGCEDSVGILIKLCPDKSLLDVSNDYRQTPLHLAVMGGHSVITKMLVNAGASISVRDCNGKTPVHIAAETGSEKCLHALLAPVREQPYRKLSPILNQKDYNGQMCVHLAATTGLVKAVKTLVYYGADINAREGLAGWTPLHIGARRGDTRLVQYLLEQCPGVAPQQRDYGGRTAKRLAKRTKAERLFAQLNTDSDYESDDDDDYDSEDEQLFEILLSSQTPINVA
ncbi:hypothetical protein ACJJTC_010736 [Scirpophaga incertulas]